MLLNTIKMRLSMKIRFIAYTRVEVRTITGVKYRNMVTFKSIKKLSVDLRKKGHKKRTFLFAKKNCYSKKLIRHDRRSAKDGPESSIGSSERVGDHGVEFRFLESDQRSLETCVELARAVLSNSYY